VPKEIDTNITVARVAAMVKAQISPASTGYQFSQCIILSVMLYQSFLGRLKIKLRSYEDRKFSRKFGINLAHAQPLHKLGGG
jgi:hypothetical protein